MSQAIVRSESPEEREYARYLDEIEIRKHRVSTVRAEIETLKQSLGRFEVEYHGRVGVLLVELDKVKLALEEYERRIWLLQAKPELSPEEIDYEIKRSFEAQREEVRHEENTTRCYQEQLERQKSRRNLESHEMDELSRVYRDLAKRFHPDLARTDAERSLRAEQMQRINTAFQNRDLQALRGFAQVSDSDDPAFERNTIGEKLVWAIREVARLDDLAVVLEKELIVLSQTSTFLLWERAESGEPVIEHLAREINQDIGIARDRLAVLVSTYRGLLEAER